MYFITAGNDRNFIVKKEKTRKNWTVFEGLFGCSRMNILRSLKAAFLFLSTLSWRAGAAPGACGRAPGGNVYYMIEIVALRSGAQCV
jgi:hypothetical protein